ncbi:TPA: hypothetical protein ACFCLN_001395, partial [Neisseria gonorrhoeae]
MSTVFIESIESALSTTRPYATEPSFPRRRESRPVRTETYRLKGFSRFRILDSRLRGNDGFRDYGVVG